MEDTLHDGDILISLRTTVLQASPSAKHLALRRGSIVVLRQPGGGGLLAVKRVVGVAGDGISADHGILVANGIRKTEQDARNRVPEAWPVTKGFILRSVVVPEGHYFLLGDKRIGSYDSRSWGPVPENAILGVVVGVLPRRRTLW